MQIVPDDPSGEQLKQRAHALLETARKQLVHDGRRMMVQLLLTRPTATIDAVREAIPTPPGIDPVCFGAVPGALARAGVIRRAGYENTSRPLGHARPVAVWEIADRSKAIVWLSENPEAIRGDAK